VKGWKGQEDEPVSLRRTLAVAQRVIAQIRHDHRTLALMFVAPVVIVALLAWILRDQAGAGFRLVLVAPSPAAGILTQRIATEDPAVAVVTAGSSAEARQLVREGDADAALVVAANGGSPTVTIVTAGVDPAGEAGRVARLQGILAGSLPALLPPGVAAGLPRIERATLFLPPEADPLDALAPVFLGYLAYFLVFLLTGISFLRERIGGTLERLLATPVRRLEIVLGYVLGFGFFASLQTLLLTLFVLAKVTVPALGPVPSFVIGLDVPSRGSPLLAYAVALVLAAGAVNLGVFLSTYARTELQILQFIPVVIIPQGLLSGIFWPVDHLPTLLQPVARVMPLTYAVDALRAVMVRGEGLDVGQIQLDVAVLVAIAILFVGLAATTIRREVA
jgi:ABC-2 type transport system permease protein